MTPSRPPLPSSWRWGEPTAPLGELLRRGGLLAFPTESSYALGADPRSPAGVAAVYRVKGREAGKPLPVVVAGIDQLAGLGIAPDLPILERLSQLWPAPLAVLLPLARPLPAAAGGRLLAVRVPAHPRLRGLLAELGPLTATSANASGAEPALEPSAVAGLLAGEDAVVVDDGPLPGGAPSTIVEWTAAGPRLVREGRFPLARLRDLLGENERKGAAEE